MCQNMYIKAKDSNNIWNIWKCECETEINNKPIFCISSRTTMAFVEKEFCFIEYGSSILCYENSDRRINIEESKIEIETLGEYDYYLYLKSLDEENKNINPFEVYEEVDFGYLEPEENELWDLCDLMCPEYCDENNYEEGDDIDV